MVSMIFPGDHGICWAETNSGVIVRSTLLQLPPRGALRAKSGGPPAVLFFHLWPDFCGIKTGLQKQKSNIPKGFKLWGIRWCPWFFQGTTGSIPLRPILGSFLVQFFGKSWKIISGRVQIQKLSNKIYQGHQWRLMRLALFGFVACQKLRFFDFSENRFLWHGLQKQKSNCPKGFKLWGIRWCPWFSQGTTGTIHHRPLLGSFGGSFFEKSWKIISGRVQIQK